MKWALSSRLRATDTITICFFVFLTLLNLFFFPSVENAGVFILCNITGIVAIIFLATKTAQNNNSPFAIAYYWYPIIIIPFVFKETYGMILPIWQYDFDDVLIAADQWILGSNPTQWMSTIASPLLTEILQIAYTSYYFLFLIVGFELFKRNEKKEFHFFVFCIVYGFFLSYIGYFVLPAVGPRFTLHDFHSLNTELPGIYCTEFLRSIINAGESIPENVSNPIAYVQRDVFPSGHTQLTLLIMYFAVRCKIKTRWLITIAGTLLIFSTVYLLYHYVTDVLAGIIFMLLTLWTAKKIYARKIIL